jgi:hypothetical protein
MPAMPSMAPRAPMLLRQFDNEPEIRENLERARVRLEELRPTLERNLRSIEPRLRTQLQRIGPELERARVIARPWVRVEV